MLKRQIAAVGTGQETLGKDLTARIDQLGGRLGDLTRAIRDNMSSTNPALSGQRYSTSASDSAAAAGGASSPGLEAIGTRIERLEVGYLDLTSQLEVVQADQREIQQGIKKDLEEFRGEVRGGLRVSGTVAVLSRNPGRHPRRLPPNHHRQGSVAAAQFSGWESRSQTWQLGAWLSHASSRAPQQRE